MDTIGAGVVKWASEANGPMHALGPLAPFTPLALSKQSVNPGAIAIPIKKSAEMRPNMKIATITPAMTTAVGFGGGGHA